MIFYELRIKIKNQEKEKLVENLGLIKINDESVTETLVNIDNKRSNHTYLENTGRINIRKVTYDKNSGFFKIEDKEITDDYDARDKYQKILTKKVIIKDMEIFVWPDNEIKCSFSFLNTERKNIYLEVFGQDESKIYFAKRSLVGLGYKKFLDKDYFSTYKKSFSANLFVVIMVALLLVIIILILV